MHSGSPPLDDQRQELVLPRQVRPASVFQVLGPAPVLLGRQQKAGLWWRDLPYSRQDPRQAGAFSVVSNAVVLHRRAARSPHCFHEIALLTRAPGPFFRVLTFRKSPGNLHRN
jgi:hypothetical protein